MFFKLDVSFESIASIVSIDIWILELVLDKQSKTASTLTFSIRVENTLIEWDDSMHKAFNIINLKRVYSSQIGTTAYFKRYNPEMFVVGWMSVTRPNGVYYFWLIAKEFLYSVTICACYVFNYFTYYVVYS